MLAKLVSTVLCWFCCFGADNWGYIYIYISVSVCLSVCLSRCTSYENVLAKLVFTVSCWFWSASGFKERTFRNNSSGSLSTGSLHFCAAWRPARLAEGKEKQWNRHQIPEPQLYSGTERKHTELKEIDYRDRRLCPTAVSGPAVCRNEERSVAVALVPNIWS